MAQPTMPSDHHRVRPSFGLRARTALGFAVVAALVTGAFALASHQRIAQDALAEREEVALAQAYANARVSRSLLRGAAPEPGSVVSSLASRQGTPFLRFRGQWFGGTVDIDRESLPESLLASVDEGHVARQRTRADGDLALVVGVPIVAVEADYFEVVPLRDVERTLSSVRQSLTIGAVLATLLGGLLGVLVSGTVLQPLRRVATAAATVRRGDLTTRVDAMGDPDLDPLLEAFNEMVDEVRDRIDRDARFASDVTHELRGPLAALSAAIEHARRHADDPEVVRSSLDVLAGNVEHFNALVVDLLEMSRIEAKVAVLNLEPVEVEAFLRAVAGSDVPIHLAPDVPAIVELDKRRMGQCVANLMENAERYAGGAVAVHVARAADRLQIMVDDAGPGVPLHERSYIFERFARGDEARDVAGGTGLGLALVREHMRLHGGSVSVDDAPDGGARFVLEVPLRELEL